VCLLFAGLIRTEPWVLAAPAVIWWWPKDKSVKGFARLFGALSLIGLGPVIWLGKDLFINDSVTHGLTVAVRVREVGSGAPFSILDSIISFWIKIPNKVGWPAMAGAVFGAILFVRERGIRAGIMNPLLVFPVLVSAFLAAVIKLGVYPNPWYFYFDSIFAVIFCVNLFKEAIARLAREPEPAARAALFFAPFFPAAGLMLYRPGSESPDGHWLLLALAFIGAAAAALLLFARDIFLRPLRTLLVGALVFIAVFFMAFCSMLYKREFAELDLEAELQKEMIEAADFFRKRMSPDGNDRIMMPSRRNEQLSWLFRDREIPDTVALREALYLKYFKDIEFLELHPDWIVFIPDDYHFYRTSDMFGWLGRQDHTELSGVRIDLIMQTDHVRIFRVTYPPGHPEKGPLPLMP
jgi:hypothetical protein